MTRQRLGQHFLGNPVWQKRIFETLPQNAGDVWIEIGAGHGEMTHLLAADGRRVVAIERDRRLVEGLRQLMRERPEEWRGAEVVHGDILALDLRRLASDKIRVYGNLPYYITSPILHRLFRSADQIDSMHFVIQFEVAARIRARPGSGEYGYLSVACQYYTRPEIVMRIPPGAFRPAPRVSSALLRMMLPGGGESLGVVDEKGLLEFVQACFGQKRKTLWNNLRGTTSDELFRQALEACGLRPDVRAEQLTLAQFRALFTLLR
jgi:16S rRNA (adenine1518-N6/adenine1519-N6)-dimethyltransferase